MLTILFRPPDLQSASQMLLLQLLLCCSAVAFMERVPLRTLVSPSAASRITFHRERNHAPRPMHIDPSRLNPLAVASPIQEGEATGNSTDGEDRIPLPDTLNNQHNIDDGFQFLLKKAVQTLVMSDTDGEELDHSYGSASQGLWLHAPAAKEMQGVLDRVVLKIWMILRLGGRLVHNHYIHFPRKFNSIGSQLQRAVFCEMDRNDVISADKVSCETGGVDQNKHNNISHSRAGYSPHAKNETDPTGNSINEHEGAVHEGFDTLVQKALQTLIESDIRRGEFSGNSDGSSSQGRWVYDPAAKELQKVMDRLVIPQDMSMESATSLQNEQCNQWLQWMKTTPTPLFLDLTTHIHEVITQNHATEHPWVSDEHLQFIDMSLDQYISRIACHVILLPSGSDTGKNSLVESTGAHIYGKLLYGGVSRFRLLKSGKTVRRAGERREVMIPNQQRQHSHPSWVQLGGLERKYEAIDMGPAAILELTLLPRLWQDLPNVFEKSILMGGSCGDMTMSHAEFGWDPSLMLQLLPEKDENSDEVGAGDSEVDVFQSLEGKERNDALASHFKTRVGGLQPQIDAIVRRVLDGRSIYASNGSTDNATINKARVEAEALSLLGLQPVRGLLLYGVPGVGKTLIVREIARALSCRPPKIVAASELLDRWVGGSERLVRELFQDAENELKMCQMAAGTGDEDKAFLNSALHVIVIDEIDAVFRKRTDSNDSGSATRDSVVNQLLAKLDGVNQLPNTLMIGMTNRRELLDPALLRPGRLEVQIEIPLPGITQRREILQIHFGALRARNRLSYPLRCAIDGITSSSGEAPENTHLRRGRKRRALRQAASSVVGLATSSGKPTIYDLAVETEGFSGADIEGLVRCSGSRALSRARKDGGGVESLLITLDDVKEAMDEIKV